MVGDFLPDHSFYMFKEAANRGLTGGVAVVEHTQLAELDCPTESLQSERAPYLRPVSERKSGSRERATSRQKSSLGGRKIRLV